MFAENIYCNVESFGADGVKTNAGTKSFIVMKNKLWYNINIVCSKKIPFYRVKNHAAKVGGYR